MKVLGARFAMGGSVPALIAHIQQKAGVAWHANRHIFKSGGATDDILNLLNTLVRPAALLEMWHLGWTRKILQATNTPTLRLLRDLKKQPHGINAPYGCAGSVCIDWGSKDGLHSY